MVSWVYKSFWQCCWEVLFLSNTTNWCRSAMWNGLVLTAIKRISEQTCFLLGLWAVFLKGHKSQMCLTEKVLHSTILCVAPYKNVWYPIFAYDLPKLNAGQVMSYRYKDSLSIFLMRCRRLQYYFKFTEGNSATVKVRKTFRDPKISCQTLSHFLHIHCNILFKKYKWWHIP